MCFLFDSIGYDTKRNNKRKRERERVNYNKLLDAIELTTLIHVNKEQKVKMKKEKQSTMEQARLFQSALCTGNMGSLAFSQLEEG